LKQVGIFFSGIAKLEFTKKFAYLVSDRSVQLLSQLFNIFILSGYLGAGSFGILIYALSIYGLLLSISNVGLDRVLVVELVQSTTTTKVAKLMVSGIVLKLGVSATLLITLYATKSLLLQYISTEVFQVLIVLSLSLLFSSWVVVDAYNQSKNNFKYTAIARIIASVALLFVRALLVYFNLPFAMLVWTFVAEQFLCFVLCISLSKGFFKIFRSIDFIDFRHTLLNLFRSGVFVMVSTICIIVYFRITQGVIERRFDHVFLGVYSLAIYLTEVPISLSSLLSTLVTPQLSKAIIEDDSRALVLGTQLLKLFFLVSVFSIICLLCVGAILIFVLSKDYKGFFEVLTKTLTALPIIFAGYIMNIYLLCSKLYKKYLLINVVGAVTAVGFIALMANFVTHGTAAYLYVGAQLIAGVALPLIMHKPLRFIFRQFIISFKSRNFFYDLRPIIEQK
jgi:O-antigen/teichoic acid export membrane protein